MLKMKQTCRRAPPYDPHVARVATMGRVRVLKEATQLHDDVDLEVGQVEVAEVDQQVESFDSESEVEESAPVRRRSYRTCDVLPNSPLFEYDVNGEPLNMFVETFDKILASGLVRGVQCEIPTRYQRAHWLTGPSVGVDGALAVEGVCSGDGQVHDMDDDMPMSWIARGLEKRERALRQRFARGGKVRDTTLWIRPGGQSFTGPTRPLPASRGKGKMAVEDSDDSSFLAFNICNLYSNFATFFLRICLPGWLAIVTVALSCLANDVSLRGWSALGVFDCSLRVDKDLEADLLAKCKALADMKSTLAQGRALFESRLEANQTTVQPEGSSLGYFDEEMADPPAEEVAGQGFY
uniref:Uncharacterized protein n=1 Tax=Cannabis sativa TaxID=3483 RepID=A0A803PJC4_CANSA